ELTLACEGVQGSAGECVISGDETDIASECGSTVNMRARKEKISFRVPFSRPPRKCCAEHTTRSAIRTTTSQAGGQPPIRDSQNQCVSPFTSVFSLTPSSKPCEARSPSA